MPCRGFSLPGMFLVHHPMKTRVLKCARRPVSQQRKRGFSLIASLTLLALLALLACAMMGLVASLQRISGQEILVTQARQQALIGLDAAIAELQEALGPDQRISARSAVLGEDAETVPPHLLGVWNSWSAPLYGEYPAGKPRHISETYTPGRRAMFRRWLISCQDESMVRQIDASNQLSRRKPGQRICLLGEGTLGAQTPQSHYVYADLLHMPLERGRRGSFAWWVSGENQKAHVAIPRVPESKHPVETLRRTWDTPTAVPVDYPEWKMGKPDSRNSAPMLTRAELPLLSRKPQAAGMPYFVDYTTRSFSLLTNAAHGGLKQDLCLLLNKENLDKTEFAPTDESDAPLVPEQWLPERKMSFPIGSWQTLHAYYNCWPNASQKDSLMTTRLIGSLLNHYTRLGGSVFDSSMRYEASADESGSTYLDLRSHQKGNSGAGYARNPVMLGYLCNIALGMKKIEPEAYHLCLYYTPTMLWWNPYNVPMRIAGRRMWAVAAPFKTMPLETFADLDFYGGRQWSSYGVVRPGEAVFQGAREIRKGLGTMSCLDGGEYFQNSLRNATEDIVFRPGEVLIFTPGKQKAGAEPVGEGENLPGSNPWVPGYRAGTVAAWHSPMYRASGVSPQPSRGNVLSLRLACSPHRLNDGQLLADGNPACMTIANGFGGISSAEVKPHPLDPELPDISSEEGKHIHSPQRFLMDWYSPVLGEGNRILADSLQWYGSSFQNDVGQPYYVTSLGIVTKSADDAVDTQAYPGMDFRTKLWQHSSPAFWGASLCRADHQQRQYHPYQLAVLAVGDGMMASPIPSIGRNGVLGGTSGGEQVSFASVLELPVHPPFSLAGFAGMRLHPGWFRTPGGVGAPRLALQRMQYQSGVPGVGIGNSFADPCLPPNAVYASCSSEEKGKPVVMADEFYDHALLINDALWDRWFCSSVSDMPSLDGLGTIPASRTLERFLVANEALPVSRYVRHPSAWRSEQALKRIIQADGWKIIASHLMVNGGFNVNSTSVAAWTAVLQGLAARQLATAEGGKMRLVEPAKKPTQVAFSRFMLSTTDKSTDSVGSYSPLQGSAAFRTDAGYGTSAWSEVRLLNQDDIRRLAEEMVRQVRARGPFLSMSDFINRRLDPKGGEHALKGALQAAIDSTDVNRDFREVQVSPQQGNLYRFPQAEKGDMHTAAPGYLIQSDVLASLGNILTVRDDTFTVRAYGCVRDATNAILSQCWCEATVQRTIDYVDPTDAPTAAAFSPNLRHTTTLSPLNRKWGRRFRVISFKWLDYWDL